MHSTKGGQIRIAHEQTTVAVDAEQSFLAGWISVENPTRISWSIEVEGADATIDTPASESAEEAEERLELAQFISQEGCNAEIRGLTFSAANWRELDGLSTAIKFDAADVHPILPDNPGNFYYATEHHVPEDTRISIGPRNGSLFRVVWRFRPERFAGEVGGEVEIDALLPLREIVVYFPDGQTPDEDVARNCALRFCAEGDLGAITVDRNWAHAAIKADVR